MKKLIDKIKAFFCDDNAKAKNAVRYFLILVAGLLFLFFSNDFDLVNVQQTAIVMAIGIDQETQDFSVTAQIAVPDAAGAQGESGTKTVNVVTQGKTVAQALDKINEKTGWYPKLVFCKLIVLGESIAQKNVFDGLEYFLRDEYISDNCLLSTCEGKAEELLSTKTPIDSSGALAIEKVLSSHAERVGTCMPNTLRTFAASYFGEARCGFLPVVKAEPLAKKEQEGGQGQQEKGQGQGGGQKGGKQGESQGGKGCESGGEGEEKVFSAGETALFKDGKKVGTLDKQETFCYALIKNKLRLAAYSLPYDDDTYTMSIKRTTPKVKLSIGEDSQLQVSIAITAGVADVSKAQGEEDTADAGDFPHEVLAVAERRLTEEIHALFEKCQALDFDLFDAIDKLQKYENEHFADKKDTLLEELKVSVEVKVGGVR
ncbi:MAG: hypothetical protein IKC37_01490 [Clostridia bacterium]|nr:hypothetical protein [Clostridia bacterium]